MADLENGGPEETIDNTSDESRNDYWLRNARDYHVDRFLGTLVGLANTGGFEIGITLSCGGRLVTGMLTSGRRYFKETGTQLIDRLPDSHKGPFREMFESMADSYPDPQGQYSEEETKKLGPPGYIHLREARILQSPGPAIAGGWWRAKLTAVDGFSLIKISGD